MTNPNYEEMSRPDLRAYILEHRGDLEAMRAYFHDPRVQWQVMPPMFEQVGNPLRKIFALVKKRFVSELKRKTARKTIALPKSIYPKSALSAKSSDRDWVCLVH